MKDEREMTLKKDTDAITNNITNRNTNTKKNTNVIILVTMKTNAAGYVAIGYACQTQITVHCLSSKRYAQTKLVTAEARHGGS